MATAYVGVRPILAGQDVDNWIHFWKNRVGTYSNWSLQNTGSHILTGFPDHELVLNTSGIVRKPRFLEYIFKGGQNVSPMDNAGGGTRLTGFRFHPFEYKGTVPAMPVGYGHALRTTAYSVYSNFVFDGLTNSEALAGAGHAVRYTSSYGGPFKPYEYQGVTTAALASAGHAGVSSYGYAKINEWKGVPSSKAL